MLFPILGSLTVLMMLIGADSQCWGGGPFRGGLSVQRLRCEYQNDPLGIDVTKPRLNWIVQSDERGQAANGLSGARGILAGTVGQGSGRFVG